MLVRKDKIILKVMNAKLADQSVLKKPGYIFEPKLDGYRALCYVNQEIKLISRNLKNFNKQFSELTHFRENIHADSCILDGEIVVYDQTGNPNFSLIGQAPATYAIFDILALDGELLVSKPLLERKKILEQVVKPNTSQNNHIEIVFFTTDGPNLWDQIVKRHLEGVMAKKADSKYYPGKRSDVWLKIKITNTVDCVIIGYAEDEQTISSVALGLYNKNNQLRYMGSVGTGIDSSTAKFLEQELPKIRVNSLPLLMPEKLGPTWGNRPVKYINWVEPKLVCEIKYQALTEYGIFRIPVFLRLRTDKNPQDCTIEDQLKEN